VQNLVHILQQGSAFDVGIRASTCEQLANILEDPRFAPMLRAPAIVDSVHRELADYRLLVETVGASMPDKVPTRAMLSPHFRLLLASLRLLLLVSSAATTTSSCSLVTGPAVLKLLAPYVFHSAWPVRCLVAHVLCLNLFSNTLLPPALLNNKAGADDAARQSFVRCFDAMQVPSPPERPQRLDVVLSLPDNWKSGFEALVLPMAVRFVAAHEGPSGGADSFLRLGHAMHASKDRSAEMDDGTARVAVMVQAFLHLQPLTAETSELDDAPPASPETDRVVEVLEGTVMGPNLHGVDSRTAQFQTVLQLLRSALCALQSSSSATAFAAATNQLKLLYPVVLALVNAPEAQARWPAQVAALPWQEAIERFVLMPPKSSADLRVFDTVLTVAAELLGVALLSDVPLAAFLVALPKDYLLSFLHRSGCQTDAKESIHCYIWRIATTLQRTGAQVPAMAAQCANLMKELGHGSSIDLDSTVLSPLLKEAALPGGASTTAIKCLERLSALPCMARAVRDHRVEMVRVLVASLTRPRMPNCFQESQGVKEALGALRNMTSHKVDDDGGRLWAPLGSLHWLLRLHTDREHRVQALAASLLVRFVETSDAATACLGPHPALLQDVMYVVTHEPGLRDCRRKREACVGVLSNLAFHASLLAGNVGEGPLGERTATWLPELMTAVPELLACQGDPSFLLAVLCLTRNLLLWQTHTLLEILVAGNGTQLLLSCLKLTQPDVDVATDEVVATPVALDMVSRSWDCRQHREHERSSLQRRQRHEAVLKTVQLVSVTYGGPHPQRRIPLHRRLARHPERAR
jgi:hypothetical protein